MTTIKDSSEGIKKADRNKVCAMKMIENDMRWRMRNMPKFRLKRNKVNGNLEMEILP